MKMLISEDWLRDQSKREPDAEVEAGFPVEYLPDLTKELSLMKPNDEEEDCNLRQAFGVFTKNLRLQSKLSVEAFANRVDVAQEDIIRIENDFHFQASPRTISKIAKWSNVSTKNLMVLAGAAESSNEPIQEEALRFAAKSAGLSSLNQEEQLLLAEFIKFLSRDK